MAKNKQQAQQETEKISAVERRAAQARIEAERDLADSIGYSNKELQKAIGLLKTQAGLFDGLIKSNKALNDSTKQNAALKSDLATLYNAELQTSNDLLLKRNMISTGLQGDYAQYLTQYMIQHKIKDLDDNRLAGIKELLARRQEINMEATKETELIESMAEFQKELNDELENYTMGYEKLKSKLKAIATDPQLAKTVFAVEGIKTLTQGIGKFGEGFEKLRQKGLSAGQAAAGQIKSISAMSILGLSDTAGVLDGMVDTYGNINALSGEEVDHIGHLAHEMGIAGSEAFKLQAGLSQMPGETLKTAANAMEYTKQMAEVSGIAPGKIAADMAKNTEAMALYSKDGAKGFAKSAVEAHKMGIDIGIASKMASGLLNFEDSINAQMEASVLLGREINLDKARELALSGDAVGASAEVLKNIGGQAEFEKMNVLQKQALAKAAGMTVEELAKAADAQQESNKYSGEEVSTRMKLLGLVTETGGKAVGFLKENGMLLLSGLSVMKQYGGGLSMVKGAMGKLGGLFGKTQIPKPELPKAEIPGKSGELGAGAKAGGGMKGLASGLKSMAGGKVTQGIGNLALFGLAAIPAVASLPFLMTVSMLGVPAGVGMTGLAQGLKGSGMGASAIIKGIANLALFGLASIVAVAGIPFMVAVALTGYLAGLGMIGLSMGLKVLAKVPLQGILVLGLLGASLIPAAYAFSLLKGVDVGSIIAFSIALPLLGLAAAGLGFLIVPIAIGALALASLGVGMIAVSVGLLALQATQGGIEVFTSLASVASQAAGLGGVGLALMGIAAGLGTMGLAGFAAMPAIGMLIALAAVAPALTGLMGAMSGGGEKQGGGDKMDTLIGKIDQLIGVASQGGTVNLDGRKVGDIVRLSINSSNIR